MSRGTSEPRPRVTEDSKQIPWYKLDMARFLFKQNARLDAEGCWT